MPDPQCVRCSRQDTSPANFLLTCSECAKKWHHRCHIPPLQEAELMARVEASLKNDIDNGLEGWICKRCLKKQNAKQGGPGIVAPRPQLVASTQKALQVPAEPEIIEVVEEPRTEKVPSQPAPSLPNVFQPYARPLHMQEASSSVSNPKPHAPQDPCAAGQDHRPQTHALPPRPAAPQGVRRPSDQGISEKSGAKSNSASSTRYAAPGPSSLRDNPTLIVPSTSDRPRHSDATRCPTLEPPRVVPDTRLANDPPVPQAEPRPPAPDVPRDSSGMPNFRAIISTLRASRKLDLLRDLTRASPTPGPAAPTPPADEDYDMEDLYWPPRPRPPAPATPAAPPARPPEASLPTPESRSMSMRREPEPEPEPPGDGAKNRAMLPIQWMQANRGEDSQIIQAIRACKRLTLGPEDVAPRRPRKREARKLSKKEKKKKKEMEFFIASDQ